MSDVEQVATGDSELLFEPTEGFFGNDSIEEELISYLTTEIDAVLADQGRGDYVERLKNIRRQRVARPENDTKDFPWPNASNLEVTQAMEKTHLATTKIVNYFNSRKPMFTYQAEKDYGNHAKAMTDFVSKLVENPNKIGLRDKLWSIAYNCVSEGTVILHVPFSVEKVRFKRAGTEGVEAVERVVKASPVVNIVPFEDFFTRPDWDDVQKAPWVGVRYPRYWHELKALEAAGYYENVDELLESNATVDPKREELLGTQGLGGTTSTEQPNRIYNIFEIRCFWDADGDGQIEDLMIHFEKESGRILRAEYNDLGMRDIAVIPFIEMPKMLYGLGVGQMLEQLQIEGTTLHNMILDTTQLAALGMIATPDESTLGALGVMPGKVVHTPVPREDINMITFPDVGPTTLQAEGINRATASTATGLSDALSGQDVGGQNRVGATGTQFLAQQSNSMIDTIAEAISRRWSAIGELILYQLVRNGEYIDLSPVDSGDQPLVQDVLSANVEDIEGQFSLETATTSIKLTDEYRKETAMQLFNMYAGYGERLIQVSQMLDNPQMQGMPTVTETVNSYFVGLTKLMKDVMSQYNEFEVNDYLPFIKDREMQLELMDKQREQAVQDVRQQVNTEASIDAEIGGEVQPEQGAGGVVAGQSGQVPSPVSPDTVETA